MLREKVNAAHHAVEGGLTAFINTVSIMQFSGTVDGYADKKILFGEELFPVIVQQNAIRLKCIFNSFAIRILRLQRDNAAEIIDSQQGRLSALPCKMDHIRVLLLNVLLDVRFEYIRRHSPLGGIGIKDFLLQVETVFAVQIADGADRLGENVKRMCADCSHSLSRWINGREYDSKNSAGSFAMDPMHLLAL